MPDELNVPTHRWYQPRNNIALSPRDYSKQWIYDSGIQKIDAFIGRQPWGNPVPGLFALAEPGVWYDPSDVANLNWRRNLLTWTEQFDNAVWTRDTDATLPVVTANFGTSPDGTTTADRIQLNKTGGSFSRIQQPLSGLPNAIYTFSVWLRNNAAGSANVGIRIAGSGGGLNCVVTQTWQRFSISLASAGTVASAQILLFDSIAGNDETADILAWGAQLELGSTATEYQRITDVNTEVVERFPTATLFQDTAGTTPVTTPGQTVALALDKSRGLVLGSELVTNGDFSSGTTGWGAFNGAIAVSNGEVVLTANVGAAFPQVTQTLSGLTVGRTYLMTATARRGTSADDAYISPASGINVRTSSTSPTQLSVRFIAGGTTQSIGLGIFSGASNGTVIFDNISVRELPGFHATQATAASRPTYGIVPRTGRRNLLTFSEQFDAADWGKIGSAAVAANVAAAPDGTATADRLSGATGNPIVTSTDTLERVFSVSPSTTYTLSLFVASAGASTIRVTLRDASTGITASANQALTSSFARVSVNLTTGAATTQMNIRLGNTDGNVLIWGAQLETGSTATAYQRVGSQFDVTEAGVPSLSYLFFDGVDDFLLTSANHPFTYTGAISAFFGFEKIGTTKQYETLFACGVTGNGGNNQQKSMTFQVTDDGNNRLATDIWAPSGVRGSTALISPVRAVAAFNINNWSTHRSGGSTIKLNGNAQTVSAYGTFEPTGLNTSTMRIGVFDTILPSSFLSGRLYSLIVRGASTDAATIANTETWVNGKTGAY